MKVTLDNVTAENVAGLTTVELVDIVYDELTRAQAKNTQITFHIAPDEVLLEAYDEHVYDAVAAAEK
jgi:hypothetical protein